MEAINQFILDHLGLAGLFGLLIFILKDFLRDWLARDAAAKLADKDPGNDAIARLEQSAAQALDKIPGKK